MNTIIEIFNGQETTFQKLIVVFWMFSVVSFYSVLVYGLGLSIISKFKKNN
jgi:hypothetical protein